MQKPSTEPVPHPDTALQRARRFPGVQHTAQWAVILLLVAGALLFSAQRDSDHKNITTESGRTTQLEAMFAQACNSANFAELKARGIVAECRLAQQGDLPSALPSSAIPSPDQSQGSIKVNVIPDKGSTDNLPGTPAEIQNAVDNYFATHPLPVTPAYERAVQRATARFLTDHPPEPGHTPSKAEVRQVVTAVLIANPPAPGQDGAPGISVTQASLDGCDVVFTLSDGSTQHVGPVCGPKGDTGPGPTDQQIENGVAAFCQANNQCRGPTGVVKVLDNCPSAAAGTFVTNVDAIYDAETQAITLSCDQSGVLGPPGG